MNFRIGSGYDVHRLVPGRDFWLGGIKIEHSFGVLGHSDGDTLIHAICDALLGAACLRDIGSHFPDTSEEFENIDSKIILSKVADMVKSEGYTISNIDSTIVLQKPKLAPYIKEMRSVLAGVLGIDPSQISIKAKTNEKLGFEGREEGVTAFVSCLIYKG